VLKINPSSELKVRNRSRRTASFFLVPSAFPPALTFFFPSGRNSLFFAQIRWFVYPTPCATSIPCLVCSSPILPPLPPGFFFLPNCSPSFAGYVSCHFSSSTPSLSAARRYGPVAIPLPYFSSTILSTREFELVRQRSFFFRARASRPTLPPPFLNVFLMRSTLITDHPFSHFLVWLSPPSQTNLQPVPRSPLRRNQVLSLSPSKPRRCPARLRRLCS